MKNEVNKTRKKGKEKKLIIISALALVLTTIMCIAFIAAVEAVTTTNSDLDAASLSLSLFKKKPTTPTTGRAIDEFGNKIATVTVKAEEEVGRVRDDFYGASVNRNELSIGAKMSKDGDGLINDLINTDEIRKAFLNSGMTYYRTDMRIQNYYSDSIDGSVNRTGNLSIHKSSVKFAYENGLKVLFIINNIPPWLANTSSGHCINLFSCTPNNYSQFNELVLDFINFTTNNGEYISSIELEFLNEPYGGSFLDNLPKDSIIKAEEYIKFYNQTYNGIKDVYPEIPFGGLAGSLVHNNTLQMFLTNMSNKMDFISIHPYSTSSYIKENVMKNHLDLLIKYCSLYNANCSRIILSEWNVEGIESLKNASSNNRYSTEISFAYSSLLNAYPSNISSIFYKFMEIYKYSDKENYYEYPDRWAMYSPRDLDNGYYQPYNVTKDFAHYHAGGNMIVNSSSNNESIKSVASLNPKEIWHITVINTATNNIRVNVDVSSTGVKAVKDLATGTIYPVNGGIVDVGILTEYDVKHYEGIVNYEPPAAKTSSEERSSSGGGSSNTGNKLVSVKPDTSVVIPTSKLLINTETNTTTSESKEEKKVYGPVKANEEDIRLYQEEYENELQGNSYIGTLSPAVSNKSYLTIAIIILGSIICTSLIISIIYRRKKREAEKVKRLMDWVDKARALGYTSEKMKEMLAEYNWNKDLVDKVVGR